MNKVITCLIFFLLSLPLFADVLQFENHIVKKVDLIIHMPEGSTLDSQPVLSRMQTKGGNFFSQTEFDNDLKMLVKDFDHVEPHMSLIDGELVINLDVWPKPMIRSIVWKGTDSITAKDLQKELGIVPCSVFERQPFNQAFHKLKAYYIKEGFFEAQLDYTVNLDEVSNEVDITINVAEGRAGWIHRIVFHNFTPQEEADIIDLMVTTKFNLVTSWMSHEGTYNEDAVQQDRFVILNYLQNRGFADAKVDIEVNEIHRSGCHRIILNIIADHGARYRFGKLTFCGNTLVDDSEIRRLFTICEGKAFSPEQIHKTVERLTNAYGRLGYIDTIVDYEPSLVEGECVYDIDFTIEEGEQYRVGLVKVFGNSCTQTPVILHETLLIPGEIFNILKLKRTEERLRNIGYFKNVNVYAVKTSDSCSLGKNYRDVYIEVEETGTGNFNIFLSFSSVDKISGGVSITERNFNYKGLSRIWSDGFGALRGGGEYINAIANIGMKSTNYGLSWTKPFFLDTPWVVGFDINKSNTRFISQDYDLNTVGIKLRAHYNVNQFLRAGWHYRITYGKVELSASGHRISQLEKESRIHGLIIATGPTFLYDSTNHPIRPTKGFRSKLDLEYAGLGGDHQFLKLEYLNSYFFQVCPVGVLRFRGDLRFIQTLGTTRYSHMPLDERIFLGGDDTVRGYRPYRLGPQYKKKVGLTQKNGELALDANGKQKTRYVSTHVPRGGLSMQLYSIEYAHRIFPRAELFTFLDAGHLSRDIWHFGRLSVATGLGLRLKALDMIPPITLGWGCPLNPRNRSEVKKFFISFGGDF